MKLKLRSFDYARDNETVAVFHQDHVRINFPDSKFKKKLFLELLRDGANKEPEGMKIVLDEKAEEIGFVWLEVKFDPYKDAFYGNIRYIHLVPKSRSRGVGTKLMKMIEEYFLKREVAEIRLGTRIDNKAALGLYRKQGFRKVRVLLEKKVKGKR